MPNCAATASMRAFGPTRIGLSRPICPASTAPRSELSSQGCATAQAIGRQRLAAGDQAFVLLVFAFHVSSFLGGAAHPALRAVFRATCRGAGWLALAAGKPAANNLLDLRQPLRAFARHRADRP